MGLLDLLRRIKFKRKPPAAAGESGDKPPAEESASRIAVLGHTGSGKTVFYAMLYDTLRDHPQIQLEAADADTARELGSILRQMRGLREERDERGEFVDVTVPRRFPPGTKDVLDFRFQATVHGRDPFPFQAKEYQGELLDLNNLSQIEDYVRDFFRKADCILFLIEPSSYRSEVKREARLSAFNVLLQKTVGWRLKTNVPVGLVISKSDLLQGFHDESQVSLIPQRLTFARLGTFEKLREAILSEPSVCAEPAWRESVAEALDRLRGFIRHLLAHTREFQIFFVSSVGSVERVINEYGAEEVIPPPQLRPIGLDKPFLWYVEQARRKGKLRRARLAAAWMAGLSLLWIAGLGCYYVPHLIAHRQVIDPVAFGTSTIDSMKRDHPVLWQFISDREERTLRGAPLPSGGGRESEDLAKLRARLSAAGCEEVLTSCGFPDKCRELVKSWDAAEKHLLTDTRKVYLTKVTQGAGAALQAALASLDPNNEVSASQLCAQAKSIRDCEDVGSGEEWRRSLARARSITAITNDGKIVGDPDYKSAQAALVQFAGLGASDPELGILQSWLCAHAKRSIHGKGQGVDPEAVKQALADAGNFLANFQKNCSSVVPAVRQLQFEMSNRVMAGQGGGASTVDAGGGDGGGGGAAVAGVLPPTDVPYNIHLVFLGITPADNNHYHVHVRIGNGELGDELREGEDIVNLQGFSPRDAIHIGVSTQAACAPGRTILKDRILRGQPNSSEGELDPRRLPAELSFKLPSGAEVRVAIQRRD